ncbi:MAG: hypothetical protein FJX57_00640, partial [Alphaproteobacteria bacterium]|nr:hypothetical protein [Alphaproteobacteria bacterium]
VYEAELRVTYPERYTTDPNGGAAVRAAAKAKQDALFTVLHEHLPLRPYALGDEPSLLDAYLAMVARWYAGDVGRATWEVHRVRLRADPVFDGVWRRYFPGDA